MVFLFFCRLGFVRSAMSQPHHKNDGSALFWSLRDHRRIGFSDLLRETRDKVGKQTFHLPGEQDCQVIPLYRWNHLAELSARLFCFGRHS